MALDEPNEEDRVVNIDGVSVLMTAEVHPFAAGQVLDFGPTFGGRGFFMRPAAGQDCC